MKKDYTDIAYVKEAIEDAYYKAETIANRLSDLTRYDWHTPRPISTIKKREIMRLHIATISFEKELKELVDGVLKNEKHVVNITRSTLVKCGMKLYEDESGYSYCVDDDPDLINPIVTEASRTFAELCNAWGIYQLVKAVNSFDSTLRSIEALMSCSKRIAKWWDLVNEDNYAPLSWELDSYGRF